MITLHVLRQQQFHGEATFSFLTKEGEHPQTDQFHLLDEDNINDILLAEDGETFLGEWDEPRCASYLDMIESTSYLEEGFD